MPSLLGRTTKEMPHFWKACVKGIHNNTNIFTARTYFRYSRMMKTGFNCNENSNFFKLVTNCIATIRTRERQNEYLIIPTVTVIVVSIIVVVAAAAVVIVIFIIVNNDDGANDDAGDNNNDDNNNNHDNDDDDDDGHNNSDIIIKIKVASQIYMLNIVTEVPN